MDAGKELPGGVTDGVIAFSIGDTVYIGGGSANSTAFYKFDPATNTWTRKGNIPQRAFGVSFTIGLKGYIGLGQSDPQKTGQASVTNDLWEYDPATDHWTQRANFPGAARDASFVFVIEGKAYVGGGTDASYHVYNDFYSYDPAADTWNVLGPLPDSLYFNAAFAIGNFGYIATGANATSELTSLLQYDPSTDSWNPKGDFPGLPRQSAVAFSLNGQGYVGLGQSQYTTVFNDFYSYDPTQDTWSMVTSFPGSHGRGWAAAVATPSTGFIGLGSYFVGNSLVANSDFWKFSTSARVGNSSSSTPIDVFPNPANASISLGALPSGAIADVRNALGFLCISEHVPASGHIDISSLAPGVYEIEISSSLGFSSARIVKQ